MRYLAIDFGDRRTGLAVGDDTTRIASPVSVIETRSGDERMLRIGRAIEEHEPDALVVGLPINMDGSAGGAVKSIRALGEGLHHRFKLPVHYVDERLTSDAADEQMSQTGLTHDQKKSRRDALAAAVILQRFFDDLE